MDQLQFIIDKLEDIKKAFREDLINLKNDISELKQMIVDVETARQKDHDDITILKISIGQINEKVVENKIQEKEYGKELNKKILDLDTNVKRNEEEVQKDLRSQFNDIDIFKKEINEKTENIKTDLGKYKLSLFKILGVVVGIGLVIGVIFSIANFIANTYTITGEVKKQVQEKLIK